MLHRRLGYPFIGSAQELRPPARAFKAGGECSITLVGFEEERRHRHWLFTLGEEGKGSVCASRPSRYVSVINDNHYWLIMAFMQQRIFEAI
jgi:hypothetical protein